MSVKTDRWIREQALNGMISPYAEGMKRKGMISYGQSSMGYDFRLDDVFWKPEEDAKIDPKSGAESNEAKSPNFLLFPGCYVLAKSLEYFQMPDDILGICYGKSTYARCGVQLNMTPIEPGWCGYLTMSIVNAGRNAVVLYAYEGIGQMVFHQAEEVPLVTYATKQGKYQDAQGMQMAKVD